MQRTFKHFRFNDDQMKAKKYESICGQYMAECQSRHCAFGPLTERCADCLTNPRMIIDVVRVDLAAQKVYVNILGSRRLVCYAIDGYLHPMCFSLADIERVGAGVACYQI